MNTQYTVLYARKYHSNQGEKTHWMHIGKAFPAKTGGFDCILYVMPPPNEKGEYRVLIREDDRDQRSDPAPQAQGGRPPQHRERSYQGGSYGPQAAAHHDEVPMPGAGEDDFPPGF